MLVVKLEAVLNARSGATPEKFLGIERQIVLKPLKTVEDKQACQAEHQHGRSVGCPVLLLVLVDPAYPIDQSLYRAEHPAQERPFSGKYPGHVDPEWLGYGEQNQKVYSKLQKSIKAHLLFSLRESKLLRFEKCICQIDKQPQTNDRAYDVLPIHYSIPPQSLSHARTYQNDTPKKTKTKTIKMKSSISITPQNIET